MSIENISAGASSSSLARHSTASQTGLTRPKSSEELPNPELKTGLRIKSAELQKAVEAANHIFNEVRPDIKFVIDESTKDVVIVLIEPETGDVISRYPTEQASAISNAIVESQARLAEQHELFQSANDHLLGLFVQLKT